MKNKNGIEGKVVLITGGSRGIGQAIALAFAYEGAKVCITYSTQKEKASKVTKKIKSKGTDSIFFQLDASNRKNVQSVLRKIVSRWGRIDILVNNAGYLEHKEFAKITDSDWDKTIDVNLKSVFICTQETSKYFCAQKNGCIINIASVGGQIGGPKAPHYAAAKSGVITFTKSAARILSPMGIRVNAISPGFIKTDMYKRIIKKSPEKQILNEILLGRAGEPEEVASSAVFLASDASSYITGQILNVNGGLFL